MAIQPKTACGRSEKRSSRKGSSGDDSADTWFFVPKFSEYPRLASLFRCGLQTSVWRKGIFFSFRGILDVFALRLLWLHRIRARLRFLPIPARSKLIIFANLRLFFVNVLTNVCQHLPTLVNNPNVGNFLTKCCPMFTNFLKCSQFVDQFELSHRSFLTFYSFLMMWYNVYTKTNNHKIL